MIAAPAPTPHDPEAWQSLAGGLPTGTPGTRIPLAAAAPAVAMTPGPNPDTAAAVPREWAGAAVDGRKPLIVYPPTLDWNWMPQRPQQILARLPARGFRVIFCNEHQRPGAPLEEIAPGLLLCHDFAALRAAPLRDVVVYATWGRHHSLFGCWGSRLDVFDNVDDFAAWEADDRQAAARADLVLASSLALFERWASLGRRVHLVPNGCEFEHFHRARVPGAAPAELAAVPRPIVGYMGAMAAWIDAAVVEALARAHPGISFVFIGPFLGWRPPQLPNCFYLGLKRYAELPAYLAHFDACLIPFRIDRVTRAANPIKFFEYAASGRPILASDLPELRPYAGAVALARGVADFVRQLPGVLADRDPARVAARIAIARANTWDARADRVAALLREALPARAGHARG
jgi:teichuronic acid biosynthesis glycosyltransferase TuaH